MTGETAKKIDVAKIQQLRRETGSGLMECKKALAESDGEIEKARDWLRIRSSAKADKLSSRSAGEGIIGYASKEGVGVLVEVNCETDFVARDENMRQFTARVAHAIANQPSASLDTISLCNGDSLEQARQALVMKVGENISIRRFKQVRAGEGAILCSYIHTGAKIAAICTFSGEPALGRLLCMHLVAMRPRYVSEANIPEEEARRERAIFIAQAAESGKAPEIAEKIAQGRMRKFVAEVTLLGQAYVQNPDLSVKQVLEQGGAAVHDFALLAVGE